MGIRAINIKKYIPKVNNKLTKKDKFSCKCLNLFINNNLSYEQNYFYRKGYETFGPLLYGYCKWLDEAERINREEEENEQEQDQEQEESNKVPNEEYEEED
jgi:hypothetical protein